MISKKAKYALHAVLALARRYEEGPVLIQDLADSERIPKKFLELILLELKRAGILASRKGKGGGYGLAKTPAELTVGAVLRVVEGPLALVPCVSKQAFSPCEECRDPMTCGIRAVMQQVRDQTSAILDGTSLQSVLRNEDDLERSLKAISDFAI